MSRLFVRLKLAHKLLICSAGFLIPLMVLLYYTVSGFERQIRSTRREIVGATVLQPLINLTILFTAHQTGFDAAKVDRLFSEIRQAESALGPLLPHSTDANWHTLESVGVTAQSAGSARSAIVHDLYAAVPRVAESAGLILDPDLDSYHLSDVALMHLPPLHDALNADPTATLDPVRLARVRHGTSLALTESRRKNTAGPLNESRVEGTLSSLENASNPARLEAASELWRMCAAELNFLLERRLTILRRQVLWALFLTLGTVGFASTLLFFVLRDVSIPLARATRIAEKIAAGQLGAAQASLSRTVLKKYVEMAAAGNGRIRDEAIRLLDAFGTMTRNLDSLLTEVRHSSSDVDISTSSVSDALRHFEVLVAEQAASTNQVVAASKEISGTSEELARNMRQVTSMAAEAADLAGGGVAGLADINTAMKDMLEGAASISRVLNTISTEAGSINSVLSAITRIANHTNLVSLNAAIEAEKAGEHAAGFSSVGLEIRRVADQTAVAALDIEKALIDMQTAVGDGVRTIAAYEERSQANYDRVASIVADLGRSIECARKLEPYFETVNSGMQNQAQSARQIVETMQQLSAAAGQTRDSLSQFRQLAEHMRAMVNALQSEVARFSAS